jgi:hypothetical protein
MPRPARTRRLLRSSLNVGSSRSCSATWSAQPSWRPGSIPSCFATSCGRINRYATPSLASTTAASPQYLGDGLLAYFDYPVAREDDARRAASAGVDIVKALVPLNGRLRCEHGVTLAVRIGIHMGPVVVGEIGGQSRREALALGETPNIAARLQALAEPDTVAISAATHRLLQGMFAVTDLGPHAVKGLPALLQVYRVEADAPVPVSDGVTATVTPLVGRDQEVGLLLARWEHVKDDTTL